MAPFVSPDQDRAHEPVVAHDKLAINPHARVLADDAARIAFAEIIAGRKNAHAGDFQIGGDDAAAIGRVLSGESHGENAALLIGRLDEAVTDAAMFSAFADGENAGFACLEAIVDLHASADVKTGLSREVGVGLNADGENHGVDRNRFVRRRTLHSRLGQNR